MRSVYCMRMLRLSPSSRYAPGTIVQDIGRLPRLRLANDLRLQNIATRFQSSVATAKREVGKASIMNAGGYGYMPVGIAPGQDYPPHTPDLPHNSPTPLQPSSQTAPNTLTPFVTHHHLNAGPPVPNRICSLSIRRPLAIPAPSSIRKKPPRDKIVQPSRASGGIPEPTPEYLQHAAYPPLMLPHPRKILVVIDLNGTLLYRPDRKSPTNFIERPYARTFLSYCIRTFKVAIWSSARPENVNLMLNLILEPELRSQVVAIWGRDSFRLSRADYKMRVQCYKRLSMLWNAPEVAASHPDAASGGRWSQKDTVLVDDSLEKARSEPYNLLRIPEFEGDAYEPNFILPQVHDYLNECSRQADVSTYIRDVPFKLNPKFTL